MPMHFVSSNRFFRAEKRGKGYACVNGKKNFVHILDHRSDLN